LQMILVRFVERPKPQHEHFQGQHVHVTSRCAVIAYLIGTLGVAFGYAKKTGNTFFWIVNPSLMLI
jgi:hypothetical protein